MSIRNIRRLEVTTPSSYPMHEINAARFMLKVRINIRDRFPAIGLRYIFNDTVERLKDIQPHHEQCVSNLELIEGGRFTAQELMESVLEARARIIAIIERSKVETVVIAGFNYDAENPTHNIILEEVKNFLQQEAKSLHGVLEQEGAFLKKRVPDRETDVKYFHIVFKD